MKQFLICLRQAQLIVNLAKGDFDKACVMCLGHVVGKGGIKPIQAKVETITNFSMPTSRNQLLRFLGMVGFYHKFCQNFAIVLKPLMRLLQKKHSFTWKDDQQQAICKVKMLLTTAPVLAMPNFKKTFLYTCGCK